MNEDLPGDLAHPRRDRASLIANLVTASVLLTLCGSLIALYFAWR
jgi:hypothetical protein